MASKRVRAAIEEEKSGERRIYVSLPTLDGHNHHVGKDEASKAYCIYKYIDGAYMTAKLRSIKRQRKLNKQSKLHKQSRKTFLIKIFMHK